ncbi:MAG: flagellar biosynthesis protein FlhA [Planctomycetes bacterium]|nr:flagellar biosynthesis protein FlhA [Planctomycetota bacterium]
MPRWVSLVQKYKGLLVPLAFITLTAVILVPLPPLVLDVLIAANITLSIIILMTTMYVEEPLDFSVFPSLLLGVTLFRLVLNVATTRLILTADANSPQQAQEMAGKVISAFAGFVAGGNLVVGVIVFIILVVVQFVVITKGATRISEVAARFTLDAMPGKQMAIDADLNAGVIDEKEARRRRQRVSREADFFGAMDGASKFVRGDAIAGIIITVVNVIGGFAVGMLMKGWDAPETARVFTLLTIGDGLASQIPAFLVAIASALVVTRAGSKQSLGEEMTGQLAGKPEALWIAASFCGLLALTPLPKLPLISLAVVLGLMAHFQRRGAQIASNNERVKAEQEAKAAIPAPKVEELLKVDVLELEVGYALVCLVDTNQGGELLERISAIRRQLAADIGLVMPPVRIRDNMTMTPTQYRVKIRGNIIAEGETRPGMLMAMDSGIASGPIQGEPTREPAFGLSAWWIAPTLKTRAESMNYTVVDPTSVLATHLSEIVKAHGDELLTREEVNNLILQLKQSAPKLVEETIPTVVKPGDLQKVLQSLLRERVPIRDLETIVETLSDWGGKTKDLDVLTEYVRNALRRAICLQHAQPIDPLQSPPRAGARAARHRLVCATLDPALEDVINGFIDRSPAGTTLSIPAATAAAVARRVIDALQPAIKAGHTPILIASPQVRAQVRQIVEPHLPGVVVMGYNEIVPEIEVESLGLVTMPTDERAAA